MKFDMIDFGELIYSDTNTGYNDGKHGVAFELPSQPCEYGGFRQRFHCAWEVFRGRARAVKWPEHYPERAPYRTPSRLLSGAPS